MSNRLKIKKHKAKEKDTEKNSDLHDSKHGAQFLKGKKEKGTIASNYSGKSSKEFARKKT